ncbi:enoyl-CoA hydratase-related protein [Dactylosporangium darangshiense]|uniref:enoyl-CoA hydratase-related protein n=1 Tax=Dactylosporangium darangshiense TaxID=579108 RepID=UPI0031ED3270
MITPHVKPANSALDDRYLGGHVPGGAQKVLLLVSGFNGLAQRIWCHLRSRGHQVTVEFAIDNQTMIAAAIMAQPDIILCPYLKERVPEAVWSRWPTVVIHPGPVGDRGPSSLDWAISDGVPVWGVTAVQAVEEMDAGPVWADRTFRMPSDTPRKSSLYGGAVADAAIECVDEVLAKAERRGFRPVDLDAAPRRVPGTGLRPLMRQADRAFGWDEPGASILRRIRAADGSPGVRTILDGRVVHVFDAELAGRPVSGRPGTIIGRDDEAVLVATGDQHGLWIGRVQPVGADSTRGIKLPVVQVLRNSVACVPRLRDRARIRYRRHGAHIGELVFEPYNGALDVDRSRRLAGALRKALAQDTRVLILRGGFDAWCNGIDVNAIEAADDPAMAAWASIRAINAVCRLIAQNTGHIIIAGVSGNAGAGGVMLPLGADIVAARNGVVLNPFYADMGLFGSELHTRTLPRRVGEQAARRLLADRLPVDAEQAAAIGLVDAIGPRSERQYIDWLLDLAVEYAHDARWRTAIAAKRAAADAEPRPMTYWETLELAQMAPDMFDDRQQFAQRRSNFVHKVRPQRTPPQLATHRTPR